MPNCRVSEFVSQLRARNHAWFYIAPEAPPAPYIGALPDDAKANIPGFAKEQPRLLCRFPPAAAANLGSMPVMGSTSARDRLTLNTETTPEKIFLDNLYRRQSEVGAWSRIFVTLRCGDSEEAAKDI